MKESQKIPKGYKKTELGVIPEDWNLKTVADFGNIITGSTPSTKIKEYWNGDIPWVTPTDITVKKYIYCTEREITKDGLNKIRRLPLDSLLITCIASIGKNTILKKEGACNQQINAIIPDKKFNIDFLYYVFEKAIKYLIGHAGITATNIISKQNFSNIRFAVPELKEQTKIGSVLSNIDSLIENLEKIIEKKKLIKQGAMQELLTGKKRLPGFSSRWEVKRLGELLYYEQPTKYIVKNNEYSIRNIVPVLTAGKSFILGYTNEEHNIFRNLPVIIFDDFTTASQFVDFPFKVKSSAMKILKPVDKYTDLRFVFCKMQLINFKLGDHKRHWISEYQNLKIDIPNTVEQSAIATVLSDMDAEIDKSEVELSKYKNIKQGMMQNLLTGKIRLV